MARALSEGTDKHSAEEFAAELERCGATLDAHADHPGVRVSPRSAGVPAAQGARPARRRAARARLRRTARSSGWCATGSTRSRTRSPTRPAAPPRSCPSSCSRPPRGCRARARAPRRRSPRIDAAAVRAFYDAARTARDRDRRRSSATSPGSTSTPLLAETLGAWTVRTAESRPVPPITADDTGRVIIVDRPGAVQTQLLIGRVGADRHDRVWPAQVLGTYCLGGTLTSRLDRVLREEKGYTYGVRAFGQVLRSAPRRHGRRDARHQRLGGHAQHRPGAGRPVEGAAHPGGRGPHGRRARCRRAEPRGCRAR